MVQQAAAVDAHFHKVVTFQHAGHTLRFRVPQDLFSRFDVDVGTRRLLRSLLPVEIGRCRQILDLGCGYGPLGLTLKKMAPLSTVHLVDRDALAVEYSRQNAVLNGLDGVEVYGSLSYDDVSVRDFDLIVSNIPAKAGQPAIAHLLRNARHFLRPDGLVAIVIVAALQAQATEILDQPDIEVVHRSDWPGHVVLHYRFAAPGAPSPQAGSLESGVYHHGQVQVSWSGPTFSLRTAHDLSCPGGPDLRVQILLGGLQELAGSSVRQAGALNPGQGYGPVAIWKLLQPGRLVLVDRDLLGLRWSRQNLLANGCPEERIVLCHQVGFPSGQGPVDLLAGVLREEEGRQAVGLTLAQAAERTAPGGHIVLAGSSTAVTRLAGLAHGDRRLRLQKRERRHGESLLLLERR